MVFVDNPLSRRGLPIPGFYLKRLRELIVAVQIGNSVDEAEIDLRNGILTPRAAPRIAEEQDRIVVKQQQTLQEIGSRQGQTRLPANKDDAINT